MATKKITEQLSISAQSANHSSRPINLNGSALFSLQLIFALTSDLNTTVRLLSSLDGSNFDPVNDASGNRIEFEIGKTDKSATIFVVNCLTQWIKLEFTFPENETGKINHATIMST